MLPIDDRCVFHDSVEGHSACFVLHASLTDMYASFQCCFGVDRDDHVDVHRPYSILHIIHCSPAVSSTDQQARLANPVGHKRITNRTGVASIAERMLWEERIVMMPDSASDTTFGGGRNAEVTEKMVSSKWEDDGCIVACRSIAMFVASIG